MADGRSQPWPSPEDPACFYLLRSRNHRDKQLVNMLLAELTPLDARQLFICHKEAFYRAFATWSEARQDWVADMLAREYLVDKAGTREALYGHEAPMEEPQPAPRAPQPVPDRIAAVGPWGAVRRSRR